MGKCVSDRVVHLVADPIKGRWLCEWIQDYIHGRESKYFVYGKDINGKQKFFIEEK